MVERFLDDQRRKQLRDERSWCVEPLLSAGIKMLADRLSAIQQIANLRYAVIGGRDPAVRDGTECQGLPFLMERISLLAVRCQEP